MSEPSIKKNFALSSLYQVLTMLLPLVTAPYISRVLGAENVGIYSFTNSIQIYFSLFAALGTVSYGTREISMHRNQPKERSRLFWEIELLTVLTSAISLILWGGFIHFAGGEYRVYYVILTFALIANAFDISWLFMGMEQFRYTVALNSLFKILGAAALFLFVRGAGDLAVYVLIMSLTTLVSNLSMWIYLPRFIHRVSMRGLKLRGHLKKTFVYFIPSIATSVYTVMDKTLIGLITGDRIQNGYYEQATKIINISKSITFVALNSVLGSRISYLFAENRLEDIRTEIGDSLNYILFMGIGLCFGIIGVADSFVPVFFGPGYDGVVPLLYTLSPILVMIGISNCIGSHYYIPFGRQDTANRYIIAGACVNLILNLRLIPRFQATGAALASIIAELCITALYVRGSEDFFPVRFILRSGASKVLAGLVMLASIRLLRHTLGTGIATLLLQIAAGFAIYTLLLYALRDPWIRAQGRGLGKMMSGFFRMRRR